MWAQAWRCALIPDIFVPLPSKVTNQRKIHGLRTSCNLYDSANLILLEVNPFHLSALSIQDYFIVFAIELACFGKSHPVRTRLYGLAINQSNCEKASPYQLAYSNNDLLTELLGPYQEIRSPIFFVWSELRRGPCVKVRASYF